jgi:hypothetical protein
MHEELTIQVPFNGMSKKGRVVWNKAEPNASGNYEFEVELDEPENLWGVGFPPSDWDRLRRTKVASEPRPVLALAPPSLTHVGKSTGQESAVVDLVDQTRPAEPNNNMGPDNLVQFLEPGAQSSNLEENQQASISSGIITPSQESELSPAFISRANTPSEKIEVRDPPAQAVDHSGPMSPDSLPSAAASSDKPADRLSALFGELANVALQTRVADLIEEVRQRVDQQVAQIERMAVSRIEEQIQKLADHHSDLLKQRAAEYVEAQQLSLELRLSSYLAETEESARRRQQEELETGSRTMQEESATLLQAHQQRLDQHALDLLKTTQIGLRASMEQQLPGIERDLLESCRLQSQHLMAAQVEQWTLLFTDRVKRTQQSMDTRIDEAMREAFSRHSAALDSHIEEHLAQAGTRLEQQLDRIGTQVRQTFLRHVVTELGRSQQVWIQQAQRELEKLASASLERNRRNLARYVRCIGESLIQRVAVTEEFSQGSDLNTESQIELPLAESLLAVFSESCGIEKEDE